VDENVETASLPPAPPVALPGRAFVTVGRRAGGAPEFRAASIRRLAASLPKLAWEALVVVAAFNALSAVGGSIAMLLTDGLGMPRALLVGSPFTNFVVPAVLLLAVVGGSHVVAAVLLLVRRPSSRFWAAFAGFTMVTWILVETAVIRGFGLLQGLYYLTGVTELVLVLALLGIVSWLPRADPALEHTRALPAHG
jgi:hypothetical protein